ncbi:MAG TPA: hypothetical protein VGL56_10520 [Fimbriimonadaceae bacterium]|jgi:hypothetical protein
MKPPFSGSSNAFEWRKSQQGLYETPKPETTFLPLDDFLQVQMLSRASIRNTVRSFLEDHFGRRSGIAFIAARGKLIADFIDLAEKRFTFGEVVKAIQSAIQKTTSGYIRQVDARELARVLCIPALDPR